MLDTSLFALFEYEGLTPHLINFGRVDFWIQFHQLPLAFVNREVGRVIGKTDGDVKGVDVAGDGVGWGKYLMG